SEGGKAGEAGRAVDQTRPALPALPALGYLSFPGGPATSSRPKRPCPSSNGPAVKNSAFVGPALAPLPNCSAHSPSISIGRPCVECSGPWSSNSPALVGTNA